jgi:hypothetical protein
LRAADRTWLMLTALATLTVAGTALSAHRLDEYLQLARVSLAPDRLDLELDLTPGVAVAASVLADVDRDGDGVLSAGEQRAYAARVLDAIDLDVDGRLLRVEATSAAFSGVDALRHGEGTIRLRSSVAVPDLPPGDHRLTLRNGHRRDISVYAANALVPNNDRIVVTSQTRDRDQSRLTIAYTMRPTAAAVGPLWLAAPVALILGGVLWRATTRSAARSADPAWSPSSPAGNTPRARRRSAAPTRSRMWPRPSA